MSLSDLRIRSLPNPTNGQKFYSDQTLPGFGIRVSSGGAKTFVLVVGTERKRLTLGRYPLITLSEARQKALGILRDRELGIIPLTASPPFLDVHREYLATRDDLRASTRRADGYTLRPFLILGKQRIADIQPSQLDAILRDIKAPITRLHSFSNIRNLFRFAFKRGYVNANPLDRLEAPKGNPTRERVLTDDELRRVLLTARAYDNQYGKIVTLCALTGQRRHQIASLEKTFIDFENLLVKWPKELMKTRKPHIIPLTHMALKLLASLTTNCSLIFPSTTMTPFAAWSQNHKRFKRDCGVDFGLHDLRRTLATRWQEMGVRIEVTERYLSHSAVTGGLVGLYQRATFLEPMREAVAQWEAWLTRLLESE